MIENESEKRGELHEPRWTWVSRGSDLRRAYMAMQGRVSLAELIRAVGDLAPSSRYEDITLNWATVTWTREATSEELARRDEQLRQQADRHAAWERHMYEKLKAKFEGPQ